MRLKNEFSGVSSLGVPRTAERLVADILQVAPDIAARAAEIEAVRRIPQDRSRDRARGATPIH